MAERDAPPIQSAEEMVGRFYGELHTHVPRWKERLRKDPDQWEALEREVHVRFAEGADLLLAGLLAVALSAPELEAASEKTRAGHAYPLAKGRSRQIAVRLLGGLVMWVSSLYCAPRGPRQADAPGVYVELAQFGFGKAVTPGLQSRVARQAALCPSFELARQELERDGVDLDVKAVRRIAHQCGVGLLALRAHQLDLWRQGKLPAGQELSGQRVTVQIDGGRVRTRGPLRPASAEKPATDEDGGLIGNAPGRSKRRPRRTFNAAWREPKLVTIFAHDERGRMVKGSQATLDGTLLGPDAMAELVAMHLHRLGAAEAASVTFVSDGAVWIWDRVPAIVRLAKLQDVRVHQVLDCCHAVHHVSLALAALGMSERDRMPFYRSLRTKLRNGQWREVVQELEEYGEMCSRTRPKELATELAYLRKHGQAGRLSYPHFRRLGLPLGSGAIESGIRRVLNLRLKGNGIFWKEDEAEAMLQVRAWVIANRWDARLREMRALQRRDARQTWKWEPQALAVEAEPAAENSE